MKRERYEQPRAASRSERQLAVEAGLPILGGPDEDDLIRRRLTENRPSGSDVLAAARWRLGLG
jgi:hypothetical protein